MKETASLPPLEVRQNPENAVAASSQPRRWSRGVAEFFDLENRAALLIYLALSFFFYGLPIVRHFTTSYIGAGADPTIFLWAIAWWPHAILNRLNPFLTTAIWAPTGCNLAWITSIPGPSLLMAPVTLLFGPVLSYNILNILCPLANAFSMFLLCRYVAKRFWPALLGGLIFAFSEYTVSQSLAHLFLLFIFPAPLAILLVLRRVNQGLSRTTFVTLLSIVLTFEFLSSTELFATTSVFGSFAIILSYAVYNADCRSELRQLVVEIATSYTLLMVVLSPYLYYVFATGIPPINSGGNFSNDLLAFVVPTQVVLVGGRAFNSDPERLRAWWEMSAYFGPGLWIVIALFVKSNWREPVGKLLIVNLTLIAVLSLGPILYVSGRATIPMPWWLFSKLPLINQALPGRFGMYMFLIAALMASIYLSEDRHRASFRVILAVSTIVFLAPDLSNLVATSAVETEPLFCKSHQYKDYIGEGDTVLFLPHGGESMSLLWQAESRFYYRLATGRVGMTPPMSEDWPILRAFETNDDILDFPEQMASFLGANRVTSIIVEERQPHRWPQLLAGLKLTPMAIDGVLLYRVPPEILSSFTNITPHEMAEREALISATTLINGAHRYLDNGYPLSKLTPWRAQQEKMLDLPELIDVENADNNWWQNLWLGPLGQSEIGIGILGRYDDLRAVVEKYGPYAKEVRPPYLNWPGHPPRDESGPLLMIFDREQLARAATTTGKESRQSAR
jgi:hypothetical protein